MGKTIQKTNTIFYLSLFCSDLQRSYKSAEIAFSNKYPIIKDSRLRECNYGDLTRNPSTVQATHNSEKAYNFTYFHGYVDKSVKYAIIYL
jgi:broad specificity phosphatase PhoE